MGFGTLFFGYFLLLDLPFQTLTNVAAALLMLVALYKLAYLNYNMRLAYYVGIAFSGFALVEAVLEALDMLGLFELSTLPVWLAVLLQLLRTAIIGTETVLILRGISDVADEVGLARLSKKASIWSKITIVIYALSLPLGPQLLTTLSGTRMFYALYVLFVVITVLTLFVIVMNLTCIWGAYAGICMPEDNKEYVEKESRFGFVNRFRAHEEKKRAEYAEYRIEKHRKKQAKRNKK